MEKKYVVLAADDEIELMDALELYISKEKISLLKAKDGVEALRIFEQNEVHLVLLDIMMPKLDGFSVLRKIREKSKIPAIMCTAKDQDYDKILGLELGADDYITKPYNPMEVIARIKAQLRRTYNYLVERQEQNVLQFQGLCLDTEQGRLTRDNQLIQLTKTEFLLLKLLMSHPGRIYTKQQIAEIVWENSAYVDNSTLMVHISNLRAKIENNLKKPELLKTVKGFGYRFEKV